MPGDASGLPPNVLAVGDANGLVEAIVPVGEDGAPFRFRGVGPFGNSHCVACVGR